MLKLYPLFSSSSGNMYLIETNSANILVDVGVSYKKCEVALCSIGKSFEDISAIFITHEHSDHIQGLPLIIKNKNIPVYASELTCRYIKEILNNKKINTDNITRIDNGQAVDILDIKVTPFEVSHDAVQPFGYKVQCEDSTLTIATDLGVMTNSVMEQLHESDFAVVESNYDKDTLYAGNYPFLVKKRIDSTDGHLSNIDSASAIIELAKAGKRNFLLAHLSVNNNLPVLAHETLTSSLHLAGFNPLDFNINLASKDLSSEVYIIW